ncbi:type VI secretion system lipoprotein TssJ [Roseivivax isoporae]|uniref:Type VI secretion protein n=1 Tax=Roseivivax isoporae LMG 25204 TaxID=1449351 RepID=X7FBE4_9RHOB|nr:type VI secretion system lipoprotein TssJ [Roseivivax isoporae]ETX30232.1 hypothetical protein RISW2_15470 [Roseivivax isoporae LMG 25204]
MIIERRLFLVSGAAALGLAGCGGEAPPPVMTVRASGQPGMNRGPDGSDRPVTVQVLQLAGAGAFNTAEYFALQDPATALGADLVKADQLVLAPGGATTRPITIQPGTTLIGVTAGFRDPAGKQVRRTVAAPTEDAALIVTVGPGGLTVATG